MAFPVIETLSNSTETTSVTSHDVTVPSGVASGDLVLGFFVHDGHPAMSGMPAGWSQITEANRGTAASGEVWMLRATGSISNFAYTTDVSEISCHRLVRISGHHASTDPEASVDDAANTTPDPASLSPSWGAEDTLWFVTYGCDNGTVTTSVYPETSNQFEQNEGISTTGCAQGFCTVEDNTATRDPSTFTISASEQNVAFNVAVRPATAAASGRLLLINPPGIDGGFGTGINI